jgi:hypothetical protein
MVIITPANQNNEDRRPNSFSISNSHKVNLRSSHPRKEGSDSMRIAMEWVISEESARVRGNHHRGDQEEKEEKNEDRITSRI